jgi:hypothetical protein
MIRAVLCALAVAFLLIPASAAYAKCGPGPGREFDVKRGESPGGTEWRVTARPSPDHGKSFSFFAGSGAAQFSVSMPRPLIGSVGDVVRVTDVGPKREVGAVGLLPERVVRVEVEVRGERTITSEPLSPSPAKVMRACWLEHVKFVQAFLPRHSHLTRVAGFDRRDRRIFVASSRPGGGFFRPR